VVKQRECGKTTRERFFLVKQTAVRTKKKKKKKKEKKKKEQSGGIPSSRCFVAALIINS